MRMKRVAEATLAFTDALNSKGSAQAFRICTVKIGLWGTVAEFVYCAIKTFDDEANQKTTRRQCDPSKPVV